MDPRRLIHATHPLDRQTVAIVVLPGEPVDFGYVYGVLFVGLLLSGFIWFIGLRARASLGRWRHPVVGGSALVLALGTMTWALVFVNGYGHALPESSSEPRITWAVMTLLSGCSLPIIIAIFFGWKRDGAPSPHRTALHICGSSVYRLIGLGFGPFSLWAWFSLFRFQLRPAGVGWARPFL